MKRKRIKYFFYLFLFVFFLINPHIQAYAKETKLNVSVPVYQEIEVNGQRPESLNTSVNYILKRKNPEYPIPKLDKLDEYIFEIEGEKDSNTLNFSFTHAGVYEYEIWTKTKDEGNYHYDNTLYILHIYVSNDENGGLNSQIMAEVGKGAKSTELKFYHTYKGQSKPEIPILGELPHTGDTTRVYLWMAVGSVSFILCFLLIKKKRKRKEN
ncbi:Spy0128 family protein [Clostridium perfringens]